MDVVHLAGYRTDADALLAAADVACLSSREEGMGSVLLDAMAFGRADRRDDAPAEFRKSIVDGESGLLAERENPDGARRRDRVVCSTDRSSARGCVADGARRACANSRSSG